MSKPMIPDQPDDSKLFSDFAASSIPISGARQFETVKTQSVVSSGGILSHVNRRYDTNERLKDDKVHSKPLFAKSDFNKSESGASIKPIKYTRIADYFSEPAAHPVLTKQSEHKTPDEIIKKWTTDQPYQDAEQQSAIKEALASSKITKEEFVAKIEKGILDNVDTNFLFNKGESLTSGLIDSDRIFLIMNKLKELAHRQLETGSKEIDYQEVVEFIQTANLVDLPKPKVSEGRTGSAEAVPLHCDADELRWKTCLEFLRKNPRLLMQMIPDEFDEVPETRHNLQGDSLFEPRPHKPRRPGEKSKLH